MDAPAPFCRLSDDGYRSLSKADNVGDSDAVLFTCTPEEARQRWVQALRTGGFAQGKFHLAPGLAYCCLGVACQAFIDHEPDIVLQQASDGYTTTYNGCSGSLPVIVQKWLGIADQIGQAWDGEESLAWMNDDGYTFNQIADEIEQHWDKYSLRQSAEEA